MVKGPAMSREDAIRSIEAGIELICKKNWQEVWISSVRETWGSGNTTPSSAILAVMGKMDVEVATGRGTGLR